MAENKTVMVAMDERVAYHRNWAPPLREATAFLDKVLLSSSYGSDVAVRAESLRCEGRKVTMATSQKKLDHQGTRIRSQIMAKLFQTLSTKEKTRHFIRIRTTRDSNTDNQARFDVTS